MKMDTFSNFRNKIDYSNKRKKKKEFCLQSERKKKYEIEKVFPPIQSINFGFSFN